MASAKKGLLEAMAPPPAGPETDDAGGGADIDREAARRFLAAVKANDPDALLSAWSDMPPPGGPMPMEE